MYPGDGVGLRRLVQFQRSSASLVMRSGRLLERREGIMPNGSTAAGREPVRRPRRRSWVLRAPDSSALRAHPSRKLRVCTRNTMMDSYKKFSPPATVTGGLTSLKSAESHFSPCVSHTHTTKNLSPMRKLRVGSPSRTRGACAVWRVPACRVTGHTHDPLRSPLRTGSPLPFRVRPSDPLNHTSYVPLGFVRGETSPAFSSGSSSSAGSGAGRRLRLYARHKAGFGARGWRRSRPAAGLAAGRAGVEALTRTPHMMARLTGGGTGGCRTSGRPRRPCPRS